MFFGICFIFHYANILFLDDLFMNTMLNISDIILNGGEENTTVLQANVG